MSEKEKTNKEEIEKSADNNLVGFFDLLLKVDIRNNPELYKNKKEYDWYSNTRNKRKEVYCARLQ